MPGREWALVAFSLDEATGDRGKVLAVLPADGRLSELVKRGVVPMPPRLRLRGLQIWEGRVWKKGETLPRHLWGAKWKYGLLFDGVWRTPTPEEWALIAEGRAPF